MFTIKNDIQIYENKTVRLRTEVIEQLETLANENNLSFNKVVGQCIDFALENMDESTKDSLNVKGMN